MIIRKYFLLIIMLLAFKSLFCQNKITLGFIAKDEVGQGGILLDSVLVRNLVYDCDTVLYGPDPKLTLNATWPWGLAEMNDNIQSGIILEQNYPNPFTGTTTLNIFREYNGPMKLIMFDEVGSKLAEFNGEFEKGGHSFVISSHENKALILSVFDDKYYRFVKIISIGQSNLDNGIKYIGPSLHIEPENLKDIANSGFTFFLGNPMMFVSFVKDYYSTSIYHNPISDSAYCFNLRKAFPILKTDPVTNVTPTSAVLWGEVIDGGGPEITARGFCWSTEQNPTTASNHTTDGSGFGVFSSTLSGLDSLTTYYIRAYATNRVGTAYGLQVDFFTWASCGTITVNHMAGAVAPVDKTVTYGTATGVPGETSKCWITTNLGADRQPANISDRAEASAGWYWQFNRKQGYKFDTARIPNTIWITSINENSDWLAAEDPCALELGAGWRIPTGTEWTNVHNVGGWTNWAGPFNSALRLHFAGSLDNTNGTLFARGVNGGYSSSTQSDITTTNILAMGYSFCSMFIFTKTMGLSIRCIRD
ncbi:MAG: hypothetical protein WCK84_09980 [Bacteroidota bacterium]